MGDSSKLTLLSLFIIWCLYSTYVKMMMENGGKTIGIRKLDADYSYCNRFQDSKMVVKRRDDCKRVIGSAVKEAQEKCHVYLDNERLCRLTYDNANPCLVERGNIEGCTNMIVSDSLKKAGF